MSRRGLLAVLVAVVCLRVGWVKVVAFGIAAMLPIAVYATAYHSKYGVYALSQSGSRFLYARLAPLVHCHDPQLHLPRYAPDGQLMSYKFHHRRLGIQLLDDQTLAQQQVQDADVVRIQPEITAGAFVR